MVRLVVEFNSDPEVVAAIIGAVAMIIVALITGGFMIRSARIQASHQQPQLPNPTYDPAPRRSKGRRRRRPANQARPP